MKSRTCGWITIVGFMILFLSIPCPAKGNLAELEKCVRDPAYRDWGQIKKLAAEIGAAAVEPMAIILTDTGLANYVRRKAAIALAETKSETAVSPLLTFLQDRQVPPVERSSAASALAQINSVQAVDPLIDILNDLQYSAIIRNATARALGRMKVERAVPHLIRHSSNEDDRIRQGVVYALGEIGVEEGLPTLEKALEDANNHIRNEAAGQIIRLRPERKIELLIRGLTDPDLYNRQVAGRKLIQTGQAAGPQLLELMQTEDELMRWQAICILDRIGYPPAKQALLEAITEENFRIRNQASVALVHLQDDGTITPLTGLLEHENQDVRETAAWVLGELKAEPAVSHLIRGLKDRSTGWMAAISLGKIGAVEAVKPLAKLLKSERVQNRRAAAWALSRINFPSAAEALKNALDDRDPEVRLLAGFALKGKH